MDKHDEFKTLLEQTVYDNFCDESVAMAKLDILRKWIKANLPKRLFRYRRATKNSLKALRKDEIWGSQVTEDNDPYEYIPCYDLDKVNQVLDNEFDEKTIGKQLDILKSGDIPKQVKNLLNDQALSALIENVAKIDDIPAFLQGAIKQKLPMLQYLQDHLDEIVQNFFLSIVRTEMQFNVACFSENNNSSLMWGHYADGHKGFCLEYDFTENLVDCDLSCNNVVACPKFLLGFPIVPICYSDSRLDATAGILSIIQQILKDEIKLGMNDYYSDMLLIVRCLLTKSNDWRYEKEWRLFNHFPKELKQHRPIMKAKAKAIYLGNSMTHENKQELLSIAEEKAIPCYQVIPSYESSEFTYKPILIYDGKKYLAKL